MPAAVARSVMSVGIVAGKEAYNYFKPHFNYVYDLDKNYEELIKESDYLSEVKRDVEMHIRQNVSAMKMTNQCRNWFLKVRRTEWKIEDLKKRYQKTNNCLCGMCPFLRLRKLGKSIIYTTKDVVTLMTEMNELKQHDNVMTEMNELKQHDNVMTTRPPPVVSLLNDKLIALLNFLSDYNVMTTKPPLVVSPLINALIGKLNLLSDVATGSGNDWALMECELSKLRFTINQIAEVVVVAEHKFFLKEITNGEWLEEVEEAAYNAADLLDLMIANNNFGKTFLSESLIQLSVLNLLAKEVANCISFPRRLDELVLKLGKVKKLALRFSELWRKGKDIVPYDFREAGLLIRSHIRNCSKLNLQVVEDIKASLQSNAIFFRYDDKNRMLDLLIDSNSQLRPRVIPIVGQDGIGKTTLAQMIYNDEVVKAHFNLRAWVSVDMEGNVPDDSIAEKIRKGIAESVMGMSSQLVAVDELDELVREALESKTCLIVLAGVNAMMSREAWMQLLDTWFSTSGSSVVILTTCNSKVADFMSTVRPYQLTALSDEDSWSLFRQLSFEPFQVMESPEIVSIARKIVARCLGIPLFLNLLGGLMRFHKTKEEWLSVHDCFETLSARPWMACSITPVHSDIHNFLSVCYHYLPPHLKQCFTYCSIFSKDRVLDKDKVIQMWIAEGLVQSTGGNGTLEEIGNVFFQELLCRSFFTDEQWDEYGETTGYRMHPLLHDLARLVAKFDHVLQAGVGCSQSRTFRQVSLDFRSKSSTISKSLDLPKHLRTLLLLSGDFQGTVDPSVFRLKSLRVLDLSFSGIQELSSHIAISQHLRYLDLSQTSIKRLPNTLTNLKHLQTLRLSRCSHLQELPEGMHNITDLRHLDVSLCHSLSHMPSRLGQLTSLQSLPLFVLGKNKGSAHLGDLHKLNLRGKLEIKNLENVRHISEAHDARLYERENLCHLGLSWNHDVDASSKIFSDLLESLWPHPKLKVLDITGYNSIRFPSWMMDSTIHNLVKVLITHCKCEELPPLGQLPYLKELCIRWMTNLQSIGPEFYGDNSVTPFPSLHQIELSNMPVLVEWLNLEESTGATIRYTFPCLNTMIVEDCPELIGFPFLSAVKNLVIRNSNKKLLCSLANLRSLSSLVINGMQVEFPGDFGNSNSIEKLMIRRSVFLNCLFEEGMQGFTSVKHLGILYCNELTCFPIGLRYLTSLQKLDIIECHDLKFMPEVRESLPLLQELSIEGCSLLASLPNDMYNLPGLQKLIIKGCLELSYLPERLRDICALRYLLISGCPKLEKRLERATGEDWFKIAHIPCVIIS